MSYQGRALRAAAPAYDRKTTVASCWCRSRRWCLHTFGSWHTGWTIQHKLLYQWNIKPTFHHILQTFGTCEQDGLERVDLVSSERAKPDLQIAQTIYINFILSQVVPTIWL